MQRILTLDAIHPEKQCQEFRNDYEILFSFIGLAKYITYVIVVYFELLFSSFFLLLRLADISNKTHRSKRSYLLEFITDDGQETSIKRSQVVRVFF
jgi:hypothetical protein